MAGRVEQQQDASPRSVIGQLTPFLIFQWVILMSSFIFLFWQGEDEDFLQQVSFLSVYLLVSFIYLHWKSLVIKLLSTRRKIPQALQFKTNLMLWETQRGGWLLTIAISKLEDQIWVFHCWQLWFVILFLHYSADLARAILSSS